MVEKLKKINLFVFFLFFLTTISYAKNIDLVVFPFWIKVSKKYKFLQKDFPHLLISKLKEAKVKVLSFEETTNILKEKRITFLDTGVVREIIRHIKAKYGVYGKVEESFNELRVNFRVVDLKGYRKFFVVEKSGNVDELIAKIAVKLENLLLKREFIAKIEVKGNKILDKDFILMRLNIEPGDLLNLDLINQEVKKLYKTGYFQDIKVLAKDSPEGKIIIFKVVENPIVKKIKIKGNKHIKEKDILKEMETQKGSVINPKVIVKDLERIKDLYKKKGYYNAKVSYEKRKVKGGIELIIHIKEGKRLYIKKIRIVGCKKLKEKELKKQLALGERGFFSWITGKGILREELLTRDTAALEAYYTNHGFVDVKVGKPKVEFKKDGIYITFFVIEGPRYKMGKVNFKGDIIVPPKKLYEIISADDLYKKHKYFNRSIIQKDVDALTKFYSNYGYAYADVTPRIKKLVKEKKIELTYFINKGQKFFIRDIKIKGNKKTRENVIRREILFTKGEPFSGEKITRSKIRLIKLDYFENVDIKAVPTEEPGKLDLLVSVKEKNTGSFSIGAGYSTLDQFFIMGQIEERNFLGKGYTISLSGNISGSSSLFQIDFWNPHLYDGPLGFGFNIFNTTREYDDYDLDSKGGSLKFSYSLGKYSNIFWRYRLEKYVVSNVSEFASQEIKDIEGTNWSSSFLVNFFRDTTNRRINPSKGTKNSLSVEYAGGILGGDDNFLKTVYDFNYYYNFFWKFIFRYHFNIGYLFKITSEDVPDFERFYLGGINTVRGYDARDICAKDDQGNDVGGYKEIYMNYEITFPIKENIGLLGVVFFDMGNVWSKEENMGFDFYKSVGAGIRWNSPLGPLRLEYGYPLDNLKDNHGKFEFSIGRFF